MAKQNTNKIPPEKADPWDDFEKDMYKAIISKLKGIKKDLKRRLDYLMKPEVLETSSILTPKQIVAVNNMVWLGDHFPSMEPLKDYALGFAKWRISDTGKGREQAMNTMITAEQGVQKGIDFYIRPPETGEKAK